MSNKISDLQKLKQHLKLGLDPSLLSDHLQKKLERLKYCRTLYNNYKHNDRFFEYKNKYKETKATMYRDFKDCEELFGELEQKTVAFYRIQLVADNYDLARRSREKGDGATEAKALKEIRLLVGANEDTPIAALYEILEQHLVQVNVPKGQLKLLDKLVQGGVLNMNDIGKEDIEDVEFEELNDEKDTTISSPGPVSGHEDK